MNAHPFSSADLWYVAGWTMIHYLWLGALVAAAGFVARLFLRRAASNIRYAASLACLALLAALPIGIAARLVQNDRPMMPVESNAAAHGSALGLMETDSATTPLPLIADAPLPITDLATAAPGAADGSPAPIEVAPATPSALRQSRQLPAADVGDNWPNLLAIVERGVPYLPWLWLIGTPITFAILAAGLVGTKRLRRASRPIEDKTIDELLAHLSKSLRVTRRVTLAVCDRIAAPVLIGIVRPMILLPPAALTGWSPDEIEMVLLHELAHVRRWDNLVNLLQRVIESLLFFHPAVWLVSTWVRREREACCDAVVVARTHRPHAYAELLVALAAQMPRSVLFHPAATSAMAAGPLRSRIRRILQLEDDPMLISAKSLTLLLATLLTTATLLALTLPIGSEPAAQARAPEEPATEATESTQSAQLTIENEKRATESTATESQELTIPKGELELVLPLPISVSDEQGQRIVNKLLQKSEVREARFGRGRHGKQTIVARVLTPGGKVLRSVWRSGADGELTLDIYFAEPGKSLPDTRQPDVFHLHGIAVALPGNVSDVDEKLIVSKLMQRQEVYSATVELNRYATNEHVLLINVWGPGNKEPHANLHSDENGKFNCTVEFVDSISPQEQFRSADSASKAPPEELNSRPPVEETATEATENTESNEPSIDAESNEDANGPTNDEFPHTVPFEQGASKFAPGDSITVLEVRGTAETFEPANRYWIRGTYTLASRDRATLGASVTALNAAEGRSSGEKNQSMVVERGSGEFSLRLPMKYWGKPHVSFYPAEGGQSFGGTYFGTGHTVLKRWWGSDDAVDQTATTSPAALQPSRSQPAAQARATSEPDHQPAASARANEEPAKTVQAISPDEARVAGLEDALQKPISLVVVLFNDTGRYTRQLKKTYEELVRQGKTIYLFGIKLDPTSEVAKRYRVNGPTLLVYRHGKETARLDDIESTEQLQTFVADALAAPQDSFPPPEERKATDEAKAPSEEQVIASLPLDVILGTDKEIMKLLVETHRKGLILDRTIRDDMQFIIAKQPPTEADWPAVLGEPPRKERVIAEKAWQRLGLKLAPMTSFEADLSAAIPHIIPGGIRIVGGNVPDGLPLPSFLTHVDGQPRKDFDQLLLWLDSERGRADDPVRVYAAADGKEYLFEAGPVAAGELPAKRPPARRTSAPQADSSTPAADLTKPPLLAPAEAKLYTLLEARSELYKHRARIHERLTGIKADSAAARVIEARLAQVDARIAELSEQVDQAAREAEKQLERTPKARAAPQKSDSPRPPTTLPFGEPEEQQFPFGQAPAGDTPQGLPFDGQPPRTMPFGEPADGSAPTPLPFESEQPPVTLPFAEVPPTAIPEVIPFSGERPQTLRVEKPPIGPAPSPAEPNKSALRYDGKTFDEWRTAWQTELSTEKRIEVIKAITAFGAHGYGKEAAEAIIEIAKQYDFEAAFGTESPVGQLKMAAVLALTGTGGALQIPPEDWLPVLIEAVRSGDERAISFAKFVLPQFDMLQNPRHDRLIPQFLDLSRDDSLNQIREPILRVLGRAYWGTRDERIGERMAELLRDDELANIGFDTLYDLSRDAKRPLPRAGEHPPDFKYRPELLDALKSENPQVRRWTLETLAQLGPDAKPALPHLYPLLLDHDTGLASRARSAISAITGSDEALMEFLEKTAADEDSADAERAQRVLQSIQRAKELERVREQQQLSPYR